MCVSGIIYAFFNGTVDQVNIAIFESAKESVSICIGLISVLVFWLGIMKVAEDSGLLEKISKIFFPLIHVIFPEVPKKHPALGYILSNMIANMFGLGNAATPLGIKAMEELNDLNKGSDSPSRSMTTFIALNTAGLTILPTTVIVIRMNNHAQNPTEIIGFVFIATVISTILTLILDRYLHNINAKKMRR
jgi:spore maturation protein A